MGQKSRPPSGKFPATVLDSFIRMTYLCPSYQTRKTMNTTTTRSWGAHFTPPPHLRNINLILSAGHLAKGIFVAGIFAIGIFAAGLTSCTQNESSSPAGEGGETLPAGQYPLQIGSITLAVAEENDAQPWSQSVQTRVTETADRDGSLFEDGDEIGVRIEGSEETGIYRLTVANGTVTGAEPVKPVYWQNTAPATVTAWYPVDATIDFTHQNAENGLAYLLRGTCTAGYNTPASLTFAHQLAKVRVMLTGGKADDVQAVTVRSYPAVVNDQGSRGDIQGDALYVPMLPTTYNNQRCWEANLISGTLKADASFRLTPVGGGESVQATLDEAVSISAGKVYNITISMRQKGDGYAYDSDSNTYYVSTATGFMAWINALKTNGNTNCTLTADIDLSTYTDWEPIEGFSGTFDGGGHSIKNLKRTTFASGFQQFGLFKQNTGVIKNLQIEDCHIVNSGNTNSYATAIAVQNDGTIENCHIISGEISAYTQVAGIAITNTGIILACSNSASLHIDGINRCAGICYQNNGSIIASYNIGKLNSTNTGYGIFNYSMTSSSITTISCFTTEGTLYGSVESSHNAANCYYMNNGTITDQSGATVTSWQAAITNMNAAIGTYNSTATYPCNYEYQLGADGYPELRKTE